MPAHIREYQRAPSAEQALALLDRTTIETAPLIPRPRMPDEGFLPAAAVVDLQNLPWNYITQEPARVRIGAGTPLQTIVDSAALQSLVGGVIAQAAELAAPRTLRNLATVAGALEGAADGPPELLLVLLALDAQVSVQGDSLEQLPLSAYQPSASALLAEVSIDLSGAGSAALARVARTPLDQAIVAAVAVVTAQAVRVVVAGAGPAPLLVETVTDRSDNDAVIERLVTDVTGKVNPSGDYRGSAEYRSAMAGVLARRALSAAFRQGAVK